MEYDKKLILSFFLIFIFGTIIIGIWLIENFIPPIVKSYDYYRYNAPIPILLTTARILILILFPIFYLIYRYTRKKAPRLETLPPVEHTSETSSEDLPYRRPTFKVVLGEGFDSPSNTLICPICSYENLNISRICKKCHTELPICFICKRPISKEDLVFCPFCNLSAHKIHFLEWLKIKASCPSCKKELDMWEFQKFLVKTEKDQKISSRICAKCKKNIPNDADFCIYCGIKIGK